MKTTILIGSQWKPVLMEPRFTSELHPSIIFTRSLTVNS